MAKYFQTSTGYGFVDDSQEIPAGATAITQAQYDALAQAQADAQTQADADELAAANQRWTTVHDDLVASGVTDAAATILANAVGIQPTGA